MRLRRVARRECGCMCDAAKEESYALCRVTVVEPASALAVVAAAVGVAAGGTAAAAAVGTAPAFGQMAERHAAWTGQRARAQHQGE